MKIVFLKDIPRVGQRGQIKEVAPGYANSLFARGLADRATEDVIAKLEKKKKEDEVKKENENKNFTIFLDKVKNIDIVIKAKANEKGHLFKAIHKDDILSVLNKNIDFNLSNVHIEVGHIKEIGEHTIRFDNGKNKGDIKIMVEAVK